MVAVVSDVALSRAVVTIEDGTGELRDAGRGERTHPRPFVPPVTTAVLPSRRKGVVVALISRATRDDGEASAAEEENEGSRFHLPG